jgi:hypothetical protein
MRKKTCQLSTIVQNVIILDIQIRRFKLYSPNLYSNTLKFSNFAFHTHGLRLQKMWDVL